MIEDALEAKGLCSDGEFRLYQESRGEHLDRLSPGDLQSRLRRARILRDKYRGVHRRQQGGARGKRYDGLARELHDHGRTRRKAELFESAVGRFEGRILALELELQRREEEALRVGVQERRRAVREGLFRPAAVETAARSRSGRPSPGVRFRSPGRRLQARRGSRG